MKPTLYIHTGAPKTGTSSIQSFLNRNRDALRSMGICYPKPLVGTFLAGHEGHLSMSIVTSQFTKDPLNYEHYRNCFLKELKEAKLPVNVLSAESFVADPPDLFEPFLPHFTIKIIHYFREIFSYQSSWMKELVKEGFREELFSFQTPEARNSLMLQEILRYTNYFGIDNCIFKNFSLIKSQGNLIEGFLDTIGCSGSHEMQTPPDSNVSPADVVSMFFYQISFLPLERTEFNLLRNDIMRMDLSDYKEYRCTLLPPEVFELDTNGDMTIRKQGELLNDPRWYDKVIAQRDKLAAIPNKDLAPEIQHYIFAQLSEKARDILVRHCPKAKGKTREPFLPAMNGMSLHSFTLLTNLRSSYCISHKAQIIQDEKIKKVEAEKIVEDAARQAALQNTLKREYPAGLQAILRQIKGCYRSILSPQERQAYTIRQSGLFDIPWYLERNPDVAEAGIDPILHYVRSGAAEGRDPSPWFSTLSYLNRNPDVVKECLNPFYHYICHGSMEGRQLS